MTKLKFAVVFLFVSLQIITLTTQVSGQKQQPSYNEFAQFKMKLEGWSLCYCGESGGGDPLEF